MSRSTSIFRALASAALMSGVLAACGGATATTPTVTTAPSAASVAPSAADSAVASTAASVAPSASTAASPAAAASAASMTKLDLNTVTGDQLQATIPGFSNRMVREFMEYRPYVSIQQFRKEIGKYVSADQVTAWEQYVYVPIDVDAADAATLQQIPGVDAATAEALIAARPLGSNKAFVARLAELIPADQAAAALAYLAQ